MLESIDKLRDYISTNQRVRGWKDNLSDIADEIECEISERYMPLPVDADGVPTHMGDTVEGELPDNTTVKGVVTTYHIHDNGEPDTVYIKVDCGGGAWTIKELKVKHCHHVKPRTVEDVLTDFAAKIHEPQVGSYELRVEEYAPKYADEIRGLLGGDAS